MEQARAHFEAGELRQCREAALAALAGRPDDVELLRLAGRAGVELGLDEAVGELRKVVELQPEDAEGWHDLGDALAAEGRTEEAADAFRKAVELNPDDELALTHLGHAAYAAGKDEDAVSYLAQAAERGPAASTAAISLVEMYRSLDQPEEALAAARRIAEAEPDDIVAALDVAELSLALGRLDEALAAFERLRELDDVPDHEVYALHGMIQVELQREGLEPALALAREASGIDRYGRTSDVLAFLEAETGAGEGAGEGEEPPPSRDEVDAALAASQAEHRLLHAEDRRLEAEDLLG